MDLRRAAWEEGVRRLHALVTGLPPEAAVYREHRWTTQDELGASLIEVVDLWGRRFASLMRAKKVPKPIEIGRPGDDLPRQASSDDDIQRFLEKHASEN